MQYFFVIICNTTTIEYAFIIEILLKGEFSMVITYDEKDIEGMDFDPKPDISKQPDMPLGLGMSLCMNQQAFDYYCNLDKSTRAQIIQNVTCCETGEQVKKKVKRVVKSLSEHDLGFLG